MFIEVLFTNPIYFARVVVILIISISLHELGHGYAAISQGDNTPQIRGHITLNPVIHMGVHSLIFLVLVGIAWGQMPVNPRNFRSRWSDVIVSAAGPGTNLILAIVGIAVIKISSILSLENIISLTFFYLIAKFNFALCMFNLLPIPPLDGFHIASEFFPELKPLGSSQAGMALFTILFISGIGGMLFTSADWLIKILVS